MPKAMGPTSDVMEVGPPQLESIPTKIVSELIPQNCGGHYLAFY